MKQWEFIGRSAVYWTISKYQNAMYNIIIITIINTSSVNCKSAANSIT